MNKKFFFIKSIKDIIFLANRFCVLIKQPVYFYFCGDIGTGKSLFCRLLIKNLGFTGLVNSPTYTLVNEYKCKKYLVYHFDLYRILSSEELFNIDIYNYFDRNNICLVEWANKFLNLLPCCDLCFNFYFFNKYKRILCIKSFSHLGKNILNLVI